MNPNPDKDGKNECPAPQSISTSDRTVSTILAVANGAWSIVVIGLTAATYSRFQKMFSDFAVEPSSLTQLVNSPAFLCILPAFFIIGIVRQFSVVDPMKRLKFNTIHAAVIVAVQVLFAVGNVRPLLQILENLR